MTVVAGFAAESETQTPLPAVLAAMQQPPVSVSSASSLSSAPLLPMGGMVSAYTPQPLGAMLFGASAAPAVAAPPPSAYLAMCNMFDAAEMSDDDYQDVEDDARDGCAAFGEVVALTVERGSAVRHAAYTCFFVSFVSWFADWLVVFAFF